MTYPEQPGEDKAITSWKVLRIQTSRGFGAHGPDAPVEDLLGLTLWCKDLDTPGEFVFTPEDYERTAQAMLDTVRRYRAGEP